MLLFLSSRDFIWRCLNLMKTLMTVMTELDQTLFETYVKAKLEVTLALLRGGLLDPQMDWYDTPQPTGRFFLPSV